MLSQVYHQATRIQEYNSWMPRVSSIYYRTLTLTVKFMLMFHVQ